MPYSIHWEPSGVYKRFTGVVSGDELLRSVIEVANDVRFFHAHYEISDYLPADRTEFSQDALNEVRAVRIGSFQENPNIRVAIVTLDTSIEQRIFSTIAARLTLHQTRVFPSLPDANYWVGRTA
jgi:hypothetical protein